MTGTPKSLSKRSTKNKQELDPRSGLGKKNKRKGSRVELFYVNKFKEMGFSFAKTTRNASRVLDACKVDVAFVPVLLQVKAGIQRGMITSEVLREMAVALKQHFPPDDPIHKKPKLMVHHKDVTPGAQRNPFDAIVSMTWETFINDFFLPLYSQVNKKEDDIQSNRTDD